MEIIDTGKIFKDEIKDIFDRMKEEYEADWFIIIIIN